MDQLVSTSDYIRILPELVLTAFGIAVMMIDPLLKPGASRKNLGLLSLVGTLAAIAATFCQIAWWSRHPGFTDVPGWFGMVRGDSWDQHMKEDADPSYLRGLHPG